MSGIILRDFVEMTFKQRCYTPTRADWARYYELRAAYCAELDAVYAEQERRNNEAGKDTQGYEENRKG